MISAADPRPRGGLELWLLRHGATAWSRNGRHTGYTDLPLLAEGEAEARALAPRLRGLVFRAVATSPLQRARRSCELAGLAEGAQVWNDLREWNYGAYEGITTAEIRRSQSDWTIWSHGCPAGEDETAVQRRCERVIARVLELADQPPGLPPMEMPGAVCAAAPGDIPCRIALFAHGHLLRSLAATWLGLGARGGRLLVLGTSGIGVLGYEREQRVLLRWNVPVR
ncbi:MAG: histidine phosphatase family protein [Cyanobium sp.]